MSAADTAEALSLSLWEATVMAKQQCDENARRRLPTIHLLLERLEAGLIVIARGIIGLRP